MLQKSCVEDTWAKIIPWVGLVMTKSTKVQTSSLKRTLFTWHLDLWRMEEGKTCNSSQTTWYHDSFAMNAKTYQMVSCVTMWSLSCGRHNKWIAKDQWDECKHYKGGMWLKDGAIQVKFKRQRKTLLMTSETLIPLAKL